MAEQIRRCCISLGASEINVDIPNERAFERTLSYQIASLEPVVPNWKSVGGKSSRASKGKAKPDLFLFSDHDVSEYDSKSRNSRRVRKAPCKSHRGKPVPRWEVEYIIFRGTVGGLLQMHSMVWALWVNSIKFSACHWRLASTVSLNRNLDEWYTF